MSIKSNKTASIKQTTTKVTLFCIISSKMRKDFLNGHVAKRRMIMDKNQGIYVEDLITLK